MHPFFLDAAGMKWTKPEYSRDEVRSAGEQLRRDNREHPEYTLLAHDDREAAMKVLGNWRASHHYPLNAIRTHLENLVREFPGFHGLTVQRTKRTPAILFKLATNPRVDLVDMQDIGGCRCIVDRVSQVYSLRDRIVTSRAAHLLWREDDYIAARPGGKGPNGRGYRGLHLIYRYRDRQADSAYRDIPIEIQLRTRVQHMWGTANEIAGLMRGERFKNGRGDPKWLRMFKLLGSAFALEEGTPTARGTPLTLPEIAAEIAILESELSFCENMRGYAAGVTFALEPLARGSKTHFFLLKFEISTKTVRVGQFTKAQQVKAEEAYAAEERRVAETNEHAEVVLVTAADVRSMKRAYPNYRLDAAGFLGRVEKLLEDLTPAPSGPSSSADPSSAAQVSSAS